MDINARAFFNPYNIEDESELIPLLRPETELERRLIEHQEVCRGLMWGEPRFGHPEGKVALHVREVMDNIERLELASADRERLRLIALAHDAFKHLEDKSVPRDWSRHHAVLARQFLESYTSDPAVLEIVEHHDEAYYAWRSIYVHRNPKEGQRRLERLLNLMGRRQRLYFQFFKCDTETGDKNQAPLRWFEGIVNTM
jgi:hypothetical protein